MSQSLMNLMLRCSMTDVAAVTVGSHLDCVLDHYPLIKQ
ncbi:hypothetical protein RIEGSTA812A_PEG_1339 [invertebrate metagenome]|uniref:Uncharacterized protein n=1 Tax=invertebrate metagenome TaxID=1711999 RepID=A0A484H6S9_9ZZZZ